MRIEKGHSKEELEKVQDETCWDFDVIDVLCNAIELQEEMVYYLIGDRLYETTIEERE